MQLDPDARTQDSLNKQFEKERATLRITTSTAKISDVSTVGDYGQIFKIPVSLCVN